MSQELQKSPMTIHSLLARPDTVQKMKAVAPKHFSTDKFLGICLRACRTTPKLLECNPQSLLGAMFTLNSLGLEPNTPTGHAFLVPFGKEVTVIVGYKGFIELAKRANSEITIHGGVVYSKDDFDFHYGLNSRLFHKPKFVPNDTPQFAYAYAQLGNSFQFVVLPWNEVESTRNASAGYKAYLKYGKKTPWNDALPEMAMKTAIRRLAKFLAVSSEFQYAVQVDAKAEAGTIDFNKVIDVEILEPGVLDIESATVEEEPSSQPEKVSPIEAARSKGKNEPPPMPDFG